MIKTSNVVTEDLSQRLSKVRTDILNFQVWSSAWITGENGHKYTISRLKGICGKAKVP